MLFPLFPQWTSILSVQPLEPDTWVSSLLPHSSLLDPPSLANSTPLTLIKFVCFSSSSLPITYFGPALAWIPRMATTRPPPQVGFSLLQLILPLNSLKPEWSSWNIDLIKSISWEQWGTIKSSHRAIPQWLLPVSLHSCLSSCFILPHPTPEL